MKMYVIFAKESLDKMGGNRGKMAAQAGHAFVGAYLSTPEKTREEYDKSGKAKITLLVDTVEDLRKLQSEYVFSTGVHLVTDAGKTCFTEPTVTCLGIGPLKAEFIKDSLKKLKVLI